MGGTFCFFYQDGIHGRWSCPIPVSVFFYQPRLAHHWNPDIPEDNECLHRKRTFVFFVLLVFVYCYHCLGKALSFSDRSGKNGHGLHLYWIRDTSFYFFIMTVWMEELVFFSYKKGDKDKDTMSLGFDTCLQNREEDMAQ